MCFDNDADWTADVCDITEGTLEARAKCYECRKVILPGEWRKHIFMQEHEECRRCEWEELEEGEEPCEEHDYGEKFECDLCQDCQHLLDAIKAVELESGCKEWESQPMLGELQETIVYNDGIYRDRALEMFPGIDTSSRILRSAFTGE